MKFEKINYKIKCDMPGCGNLADYVFVNKKMIINSKTHFCNECTVLLYNTMGTFIVPKSPKNIFNDNKK